MLASLALAIAVVSSSNQSAPNVCGYADSVHLENIPITPAPPSTDIVHAVAITTNGRLIGYVFVLNNGRPWYSDGFVGRRYPEPTREESVSAMLVLGFPLSPQMGVGGVIPLTDVSLVRFMNAGFGVHTCY